MKIASVTITMNDWHSVSQWFEFYSIYKDNIYKHIIVDNGSSREYVDHLKEKFVNSIIVERSTNGGTTAAYNDGIRIALSDIDVDSILLLANDIKLNENTLQTLYEKLFKDDLVGMVAPIMLMKDSYRVESFGMYMKTKVALKNIHQRKRIDDLELNALVDMVPGGMHLSRRELYEKIGLQDESLFMYSDEVDWAIRIKQNGYKVLVTREVLCWHQHINFGNRKGRSAFAVFLQARNKLLLAYKHYGVFVILHTFFMVNCRNLPGAIWRSIVHKDFNLLFYYFLGTIYGVFNSKKLIAINKK